MKKFVVAVFLLLSTAALAKPVHLLFHAGKTVAYPIRHPQNTAHGFWKFVTTVF